MVDEVSNNQENGGLLVSNKRRRHFSLIHNTTKYRIKIIIIKMEKKGKIIEYLHI